MNSPIVTNVQIFMSIARRKVSSVKATSFCRHVNMRIVPVQILWFNYLKILIFGLIMDFLYSILEVLCSNQKGPLEACKCRVLYNM